MPTRDQALIGWEFGDVIETFPRPDGRVTGQRSCMWLADGQETIPTGQGSSVRQGTAEKCDQMMAW